MYLIQGGIFSDSSEYLLITDKDIEFEKVTLSGKKNIMTVS